jgi:glycosyltransferase involved in cell wall biosynthesis
VANVRIDINGFKVFIFMKLLLIITDFGSFNNFLAELALTISQKQDYELHVICSKAKIINIDNKAVFENKNIRFHFVDIPRRITLWGEWKAARAIHRIVDTIRPDLVHIHFTTAAFPSTILKHKKVPYWATIHGLGMNASSGFRKIMFTSVEMMAFARLSKIYVVNRQDYTLVNKYFNGKVKKYECLGFGCDTNRFSNEHVPISVRQNIKTQYGLEDHHFVISFTGRFVAFKGFHIVVKAFKQLSDLQRGRFKLILMGGTDPIHQTGLDEAETSFFTSSPDIANIGFSSNVERYLSISNVFLFPSVKEGLPTCTLEALSMGVPVISFNTRGNNDIIVNNYNGLLLEPDGDIEAQVNKVVQSLLWMSENKDKCLEFGLNALKDRNAYSRNRFVDEQLRYYSEFQQLN